MDTILNNDWGVIALLLGAGGLLILLALGIYRLNIRLVERGTHPALIKILNQAIALAWKAAGRAIEEGRGKLTGIEKKRVADGLYDTGGDLLMKLQMRYLPISIDLRDYITRAEWSLFVQARFDRLTEGLDNLLDLMGEEQFPLVHRGG